MMPIEPPAVTFVFTIKRSGSSAEACLVFPPVRSFILAVHGLQETIMLISFMAVVEAFSSSRAATASHARVSQ